MLGFLLPMGKVLGFDSTFPHIPFLIRAGSSSGLQTLPNHLWGPWINGQSDSPSL